MYQQEQLAVRPQIPKVPQGTQLPIQDLYPTQQVVHYPTRSMPPPKVPFPIGNQASQGNYSLPYPAVDQTWGTQSNVLFPKPPPYQSEELFRE